jgi:hypothetical protein
LGGGIICPQLRSIGGAYYGKWGGARYQVFPFIKGKSFEEAGGVITRREWNSYTSIIADVHRQHLPPSRVRGPNDVTGGVPAIVENVLRKVERRRRGPPHIRNLYRRIAKEGGRIRKECRRALGFRALANTGKAAKVLCHGDLNPWNVLRLAPDRLGLIDWDYVCLQWRERDLQSFCTYKDFSGFTKRYLERLDDSSVRVSMGLLKYFRWMWELLLGADRAERILDYEAGSGESLHSLWEDLNDLWFQDFDFMDRYIDGVSADLYSTKRLVS